ncbi:MAG: Hpt domain-containing protein, partial [Magnetococcales bacterium]|nr:Hpt domain-containing protein [Magnetococcales bacterium]
YAQSGAEVRQLLLAGEDARARQMLHALGGVAGNMGAQTLMNAARALERICVPGSRLDDPALMESLDHFVSSLSQVLTSVQGVLTVGAESGRTLDPDALKRVRHHVDALETLVTHRQVVEAMHEITALHRLVPRSSWMGMVEQLMEHLFDGNLVLAERLVRRLQETLNESGSPGADGETV